MADSLLSALLPVVMEKAADQVLQQFGVMWGIHKNQQKLERALLAIQGILGDAEERQVKEEGVKRWLAALKDAAYEADDILDEFNWEAIQRKVEIHVDITKKVRSFFSRYYPIRFHLKMRRKLNDIVEKIEKLVEEGNKFNFNVKTQPQKRDRSQTHSHVVESEVIGREKEKEEIVKLLLDPKKDIEVLPIVGMGGLGKTTLPKLICQDRRVQTYFQPIIWVCVSEEFDVAKVASKIIAAETWDECGLSNMELLQRRIREVVSAKRYLLVLDDVWNEDREKWDDLKSLLPAGGEGSRIIVTARKKQVSSMMVGALPTYEPSCLTMDDSWTLFRKKAFEEGAEKLQNLVSIGMQIVEKCHGLPLAVKTLGALMRSKSQEREWLSVRDSEIWDMQVGEDEILPALRLSYSHLPSYLKQCFAFCAIFPKNYEIEKDLLIQLWMANGFIKSDGEKKLEDKGHEVFNELAWGSFFQDVNKAEEYGASSHELYYITTCKMHDLMHDLARIIVGKECLAMRDPAEWKEVSGETCHLSASWNFQLNIDRTLNNYPNICTLLYLEKGFHNSIRVTTDSSKPKSLRALDLHGNSIVQLPIAIRYLKHLRYLDLSHTAIEALPDATSTLFNLQTLKLSKCKYLCKLPEDMRNMSSLKHLYIDRCPKLEHLPAGIGQLSSLRTLTKYVVGNDAEKQVGELQRLNLGGLLELYNLRNVKDAADAKEANLSSKDNLCSLILCWDMVEWNPPDCYEEDAHRCYEKDVLPVENAEEVLEALGPHGGLKLLTVWRYGGDGFSTWMMDSLLLQNIVEIHLGVCTGCQHLPPLWQLPFLKFLFMIKMDNIQHICSGTIYNNASNDKVQASPSLKRLVLHTMQSLEKWSEYEGTAEVTLVFPRLAEIKIINCPNLMTMPELPSLKSLEMKGTKKQLGLVCSLMTLHSLSIGVYQASNGTESPPLGHKKMSFRYFRSLEKLTITASEDLAPLLEEEEETRGLSTSLHSLEIYSCNWLFSPLQQSSSPLAFWKNLGSLQSLSIESCDDLVYWPVAEFRGLNSLENLSLQDCNNLVGPSPLPLSSSSSEDGEILPNLEYLDIMNCNGLLEMPMLPASLRSLFVYNCPKLNSLTEGLRNATALESFHIFDCPSLTSLPVDLGHLTTLTTMDISQLPGLQSLPQGLGQLTALESLDIRSCNELSSLPEGLQRLTALQHLSIRGCPRLSSLPEGLQQRLPGLQHLVIEGSPGLEKRCKRGGPYWHLISRIPNLEILPERRSNFSTFHPSFSCFRRPSAHYAIAVNYYEPIHDSHKYFSGIRGEVGAEGIGFGIFHSFFLILFFSCYVR